MEARQFYFSLIIAALFFIMIIRLIQKGKLDIAYSWMWLGMGGAILIVVLRYDWLIWLTHFIGAGTATTTLFLFAILIILVLCLQFSIVVSSHRQQIKKLTQELAINSEKKPG